MAYSMCLYGKRMRLAKNEPKIRERAKKRNHPEGARPSLKKSQYFLPEAEKEEKRRKGKNKRKTSFSKRMVVPGTAKRIIYRMRKETETTAIKNIAIDLARVGYLGWYRHEIRRLAKRKARRKRRKARKTRGPTHQGKEPTFDVISPLKGSAYIIQQARVEPVSIKKYKTSLPISFQAIFLLIAPFKKMVDTTPIIRK